MATMRSTIEPSERRDTFVKVLLTSGFPEGKLNGKRRPPRNVRLRIKPYRKDDLARVIREVPRE
jgi:hypothetical protein